MNRRSLVSDQTQCPCGGVILADTEDWPIPMCHECYEEIYRQYKKIWMEEIISKSGVGNGYIRKTC